MTVSSFGPLSNESGEIADVAGDHDPLLAGCENEDLAVGQAGERCVAVECEHVVTPSAQRAADAPPGDVRVEQEAHALLVRARECEPGEGLELAQLRGRPAVVGDLLVDLSG